VRQFGNFAEEAAWEHDLKRLELRYEEADYNFRQVARASMSFDT
jgi:hypothetical protein